MAGEALHSKLPAPPHPLSPAAMPQVWPHLHRQQHSPSDLDLNHCEEDPFCLGCPIPTFLCTHLLYGLFFLVVLFPPAPDEGHPCLLSVLRNHPSLPPAPPPPQGRTWLAPSPRTQWMDQFLWQNCAPPASSPSQLMNTYPPGCSGKNLGVILDFLPSLILRCHLPGNPSALPS